MVDLLSLGLVASLVVKEMQFPQQFIGPEAVLFMVLVMGLLGLLGGTEARDKPLNNLGLQRMVSKTIEQLLVVLIFIKVLFCMLAVLLFVVLWERLVQDLVNKLGIFEDIVAHLHNLGTQTFEVTHYLNKLHLIISIVAVEG